jgi:hypothetical protein
MAGVPKVSRRIAESKAVEGMGSSLQSQSDPNASIVWAWARLDEKTPTHGA